MANVMSQVFDFIAKTTNFERGTQRVEGGLQGIGRTVGRVAGAVGLAFGGREVLQWAGDAVQAAESAEAVRDSVDKLIPSSDRLRRQFDDLRTASGLSKAEFNEMILPLATLLSNMGVSELQMKPLLDGLIGASGNLAAMRGDLDLTDDAMDGFFSLIKGEVDKLENFGISIKDTEVEQRALEMTGKRTTSMLTAQDKVLARVDLAMEQAAVATGEFEDAQSELETQIAQNRMEAGYEDMKVTVGNAFRDMIGTIGLAVFGYEDNLTRMTDGTSDAEGVLRDLFGEMGRHFDEAAAVYEENTREMSKAEWLDALIQKQQALIDQRAALEEFFRGTAKEAADAKKQIQDYALWMGISYDKAAAIIGLPDFTVPSYGSRGYSPAAPPRTSDALREDNRVGNGGVQP